MRDTAVQRFEAADHEAEFVLNEDNDLYCEGSQVSQLSRPVPISFNIHLHLVANGSGNHEWMPSEEGKLRNLKKKYCQLCR